MAKRWYQKVLTRVRTIIGILAGICVIAAFVSQLLPRAIQLRKIENIIKERIEEVNAVRIKQRDMNIAPRFMTLADLQDTLDQLSKYNEVFDEIDLASLIRLIKDYGSKELQAKFEVSLEDRYDAFTNLLSYVRLISEEGSAKSEKENNERHKKYVDLADKFTAAEARLYGFIVSLTPKDFKK